MTRDFQLHIPHDWQHRNGVHRSVAHRVHLRFRFLTTSVRSLVQHNSHKTRQGAPDYTKQFVDTMIARETSMLGLHRASMRAPLPQGGVPGRTPIHTTPHDTARGTYSY